VLVNGALGIGTGWSTYIPPFSLSEIIAAVKAKLHGVDP